MVLIGFCESSWMSITPSNARAYCGCCSFLVRVASFLPSRTFFFSLSYPPTTPRGPMAPQYPYDVDLLENDTDDRDELRVSFRIDAHVLVDIPTRPSLTLKTSPRISFLVAVNRELVRSERGQLQYIRHRPHASRRHPYRQQSLFRGSIIEAYPRSYNTQSNSNRRPAETAGCLCRTRKTPQHSRARRRRQSSKPTMARLPRTPKEPPVRPRRCAHPTGRHPWGSAGCDRWEESFFT